MNNPKSYVNPVAKSVPFDNSAFQLDNSPSDVQSAIENLLKPFGSSAHSLTASVQATTATTKTLVKTSHTRQIFTGTIAGQVVKLPDATTLQNGHIFDIWNVSSQTIAVQNNGSGLLETIRANGITSVILRDNSTSNGVWVFSFALDSGNVFGTNILFTESESETSNNSGVVWANKLTLTTPSNLILGDYLMNFQFIWRSSSANREADFRFQLNGNDIVAWQPSTSRIQDRQLLSGFRRLQSISGTNTITFDFKYANSSTTIFVQQARMFLWRIQ